jgi:hypothetical protein
MKKQKMKSSINIDVLIKFADEHLENGWGKAGSGW